MKRKGFEGGHTIAIVMGVIVLLIVVTVSSGGLMGEWMDFDDFTDQEVSQSECELWEARQEEPGDYYSVQIEEHCDDFDQDYGNGGGPNGDEAFELHSWPSIVEGTEDENNYHFEIDLDELEGQEDLDGETMEDLTTDDMSNMRVVLNYPDEDGEIEDSSYTDHDYDCSGSICTFDNELSFDDIGAGDLLDCEESHDEGASLILGFNEVWIHNLAEYDVEYREEIDGEMQTCWE